MLEKSLPKNETLAGAAGFAGSSLAVPSLAKVVPSLKPPARPKRPCDAGACGVGVASSLFRSVFASLLSDALDSNEAVLNEDFSGCPKIELLCCAGVFAQEGSEDPVLEPTVTVEPKLGSVFRPPKPDFCCPCPSDAKPEPVCAELLLPKLEKELDPPAPPNLAKPDEPPAAAEKGLDLDSEDCAGAPHGDALFPIPPAAPKPEPLPAPTADGAPKAG